MRRKFCQTLMVVLAIASAHAGIDFTPSIQQYNSEGFVYSRVKLKTDTGSVAFVAPLGWNVAGSKERLVMTPPRTSFAEGSVVASPLAAPPTYDDAFMKKLEQEVLASAPAGTQSAEIVSRDQNPAVGQNTSISFVMSYAALGRTFHRSVTFVYTPDTLLVLRFTAPKADFPELSQAFRQTMSSWQWAQAAPEQTGGTR